MTDPDNLRCTLAAGHSGFCDPHGMRDIENEHMCTLKRRSMDVYESNLSVVTNADNWPELDGQIPINWSAIVDAENDLVCVVPPHVVDYHDFSTRSEIDLQTESKIRAQIICDILNMVQNDG